MSTFAKCCLAAALAATCSVGALAAENHHFWNHASLGYIKSDYQNTYILRGRYELGYRTYGLAGLSYSKIDTFTSVAGTYKYDPLKSIRVGLGHYFPVREDVFVYGELIYYRDKYGYTLTRNPDYPILCPGGGCPTSFSFNGSAIFTTIGTLWQINEAFDVGLEYVRLNNNDGADSNRLAASARYRLSDDVAVRYIYTKSNGSDDTTNQLQLIWTF